VDENSLAHLPTHIHKRTNSEHSRTEKALKFCGAPLGVSSSDEVCSLLRAFGFDQPAGSRHEQHWPADERYSQMQSTNQVSK
jgi:hypothetical protein